MEQKKPNILFLFSDQHNANVLGCYGNKECITPNLDRLAGEGIKCNNAYTQNPICTPSRISYFSGQYPHNHGFFGNESEPSLSSLPNIFGYFKKYGYKTAAIGKIHTPREWVSKNCDLKLDSCDHEHEDRHNDFKDYLEKKGLGELNDNGNLQEWRKKIRSGEIKINQINRNVVQALDSRPTMLPESDCVSSWLSNNTIDFINKCNDEEKPFLAFMSSGMPHQTYTPCKKFWDMYDEERLTLPPNADNGLAGRHEDVKRKRAYFKENEVPEWTIFEPGDYESARKRVLRGYYACVTEIDDAYGKVINQLEHLGIKEDTIIVYASDHGDFAGEHGMIEKAPGIAFRAITRIPFILRYKKKLPENFTVNSLIETVDLLPTLASLCEIDSPDWCDGKDVTETLRNDKPVREIAVTENALTKAVATENYRFVYYQKEMCNDKDFGELYDIKKDPWELKNLYFDEEYIGIINSLKTKLLDWIIKTSRHYCIALARRSDSNNSDDKCGIAVEEEMIANGDTFYL